MKILTAVFAVIIVILLAALVFIPSAKSPTVPQATSSASGAWTAGDAGIVQGRVVLGPVCPVERIPPDPACAPRPYQTSITILRNGGSAARKTIQSDSSGAFIVSLAAGSYTFYPQGGSVYPRCGDQSVTVVSGKTSNVTITCDTGIR